MEEFIVIVSVAAAVLQIILFFKVWVMTDDIKKIKKRLSTTYDIREVRVTYMLGNKEKAKWLLDKSLYEDVIDDWRLHQKNKEEVGYRGYYNNIVSTLEKYKSIYAELNLEMPKIDIEKHPFGEK